MICIVRSSYGSCSLKSSRKKHKCDPLTIICMSFFSTFSWFFFFFRSRRIRTYHGLLFLICLRRDCGPVAWSEIVAVKHRSLSAVCSPLVCLFTIFSHYTFSVHFFGRLCRNVVASCELVELLFQLCSVSPHSFHFLTILFLFRVHFSFRHVSLCFQCIKQSRLICFTSRAARSETFIQRILDSE